MPPAGKKQSKGQNFEFENPIVARDTNPIASWDSNTVNPPGDFDSNAFDQVHAAEDPGSLHRIRELKNAIQMRIFSRSNEIFAAQALGDFQGASNVVGVGIGRPDLRRAQSIPTEGPGCPVLNVYLAEPMEMESVRRSLFDEMSVHAVADDSLSLNLHYSGIIDAYAHRHRARPAPCGISVSHVAVTAGTLGCLARGLDEERGKKLLLLSNNHVIANSNEGQLGDPIIQPGDYDGGKDPADRIAVLERFVGINFAGGDNFVDAATGWCWKELVRPDFIFRSRNGWNYFKIGDTPRQPEKDMRVGKSGRTTQLTAGYIIDTDASLQVNYGGGRVANFVDQITVVGSNGNFSEGGDSGSLIWTYDERRDPVALLFAGGRGYTFANKIGHVLKALDIRIV